MRDFTRDNDETLVRFWNDGDGSISWSIALEEELKRRGFETRNPHDGLRSMLTIDGEPL
jgi:hypothetical protein